VSEALALWEDTEKALQTLAGEKHVADMASWVQVAAVVSDCVGLSGTKLTDAVARAVTEWEKRQARQEELQKEEQSVWDPGGNATSGMAVAYITPASSRGNQHPVDFKPTLTVEEFRILVMAETNVEPGKQQLMYNGRKLTDKLLGDDGKPVIDATTGNFASATLADFGVEHEATILLLNVITEDQRAKLAFATAAEPPECLVRKQKPRATWEWPDRRLRIQGTALNVWAMDADPDADKQRGSSIPDLSPTALGQFRVKPGVEEFGIINKKEWRGNKKMSKFTSNLPVHVISREFPTDCVCLQSWCTRLEKLTMPGLGSRFRTRPISISSCRRCAICARDGAGIVVGRKLWTSC
jgi:hypothetical protein